MPRRHLHPTHLVYILAHALIFLLGYALATSTEAIAKGIGASLIAAAITGWVVFVYVFLAQNVSDRLTLLTEFGFLSAFEARAARIKPEYDKRLTGASERIDILGFGLRALREDYLEEFERWTARARVRILLLDPEAPDPDLSYAKQRDREERNSEGTIKADVLEFVRQTSSLIRGINTSRPFEVRLYRCLPSINILRVDDELFWGPYLIREQSRNCPTFIVRRGGILFLRLTAHFDSIWNDDNLSRQVPADWLVGG